jgi:choline kinase
MEKHSAEKTGRTESLHRESRKWSSQLQFMADEIVFFEHLLNTYVFEPDTPALFESMQSYQKALKKSNEKATRVRKAISVHENKLGGLLEISNEILDAAYDHKHREHREEVEACLANFQELKVDLFTYAKQILKKRHKP